MQQLVLYTLCALLCARLSAGEGRGQADDCTSGFMSVDRIDAVLDNYVATVFLSFSDFSVQVIVPWTNFTCNGSILSWTIGARWEGNTAAFTELQIWRSSGSGSYDKIGSTTINVTGQNATEIYQYPLSSPLAFRAGDILGFFQPATSTSQLGLYHEGVTTTNYLITSLASPASQFNIDGSIENLYQPMIDVETDSGCGCGFMSVERMRILRRQETVGSATNPALRQQITPDIKFTCEGLITKWIIGASIVHNNALYPELQVWRNIGNDTYQKRNGTFINIPTENSNRFYEYDNFSAIPFQAGDILGVFLPQTGSSRISLLSENTNSPTNYYLDTESSDTVSPFDTIDIQTTQSLRSQGYHPLVSVEIVKNSPISSATLSVTPTASVGGSQSNATPSVPTETTTASQSDSQSSLAAVIGGAIAAAAVVLLIVVLVLAVVVVLVVRQKRSKSTAALNGKERGKVGSQSSLADNPLYSDGGGGPVTMTNLQYHHTESQEHLYEAPRPEAVYESPPDKEKAVYEAPPTFNGATYDEVPPDATYEQISRDPVATEPDESGLYRKFVNPIYGDAAPDSVMYANVETEYK